MNPEDDPFDDIQISPLAPEDWPASLVNIISDMGGKPLNIHRLLAHHPELLSAWWSFRNYAVGGGELTPRNRELLILRVAHCLQSGYEWDSHVVRGHAAGLSLEEISRVRAGPEAAGWTEAEAVLLCSVDECLEERRIKPMTLQRLSEHFSKRQVLDIIAIHSLYLMLGVIIGTWDLELDDFVQLPSNFL